MCLPAIVSAVGSAVASIGSAVGGVVSSIGGLSGAATLASMGLSLAGGLQARAAANANVRALEAQKLQEKRASAVEDQRTRRAMRAQMRQQAAELAARGIQLDSPTAVLLGQTAAAELSFASQSVRQKGAAQVASLTNAQRRAQAEGTMALLSGVNSAAGTFLTAAPSVWPELMK